MKLANFYVNPPDELEDDNNVNISNLHSCVTNLIKQLNYGMGNIDTDNLTDDLVQIIENMQKGDE